MMSKSEYERETARTRAGRMRWWKEARFGMFVHWGLYSALGRHEWAQAIECIPSKEYEKLARKFKPKPRAAREWARLAREAGMKYMVMTTKHHEGFCLWPTKQTDFHIGRSAPGRDLVGEYVAACREFGLRVGFYYSLMDWHHPDGARCAYDPAARRRFLDFTRGCVRELLSRYGKIDVLWYDVPRPMESHEGWESVAMNQMARSLQPGIAINERSKLPEDFGTPEEKVAARDPGREWEACMTFNQTSWGYMPSAAADAYSGRQIVKMLNTACAGGGNLLLNIGPTPEGDVPGEAVAPLRAVGRWLKRNGAAVYGRLDRARGCGAASGCGGFSRKGKTMYFWCANWPGREFGLGGFQARLKSARFLVGGGRVAFEQKGNRIVLKKLPAESPDTETGVTVIRLDFAQVPTHVWHADTPAFHT